MVNDDEAPPPENTDNVLRKTLYVAGLDDELVDKKVLEEFFSPFGTIRRVELPASTQSKKHRGYGFVEFEEEADAQEAMENLDASELFGRVLTVHRSRDGFKGVANRPVWADELAYREKLAEHNLDVPD